MTTFYRINIAHYFAQINELLLSWFQIHCNFVCFCWIIVDLKAGNGELDGFWESVFLRIVNIEKSVAVTMGITVYGDSSTNSCLWVKPFCFLAFFYAQISYKIFRMNYLLIYLKCMSHCLISHSLHNNDSCLLWSNDYFKIWLIFLAQNFKIFRFRVYYFLFKNCLFFAVLINEKAIAFVSTF